MTARPRPTVRPRRRRNRRRHPNPRPGPPATQSRAPRLRTGSSSSCPRSTGPTARPRHRGAADCGAGASRSRGGALRGHPRAGLRRLPRRARQQPRTAHRGHHRPGQAGLGRPPSSPRRPPRWPRVNETGELSSVNILALTADGVGTVIFVPGDTQAPSQAGAQTLVTPTGPAGSPALEAGGREHHGRRHRGARGGRRRPAGRSSSRPVGSLTVANPDNVVFGGRPRSPRGRSTSRPPRSAPTCARATGPRTTPTACCARRPSGGRGWPRSRRQHGQRRCRARPTRASASSSGPWRPTRSTTRCCR